MLKPRGDAWQITVPRRTQEEGREMRTSAKDRPGTRRALTAAAALAATLALAALARRQPPAAAPPYFAGPYGATLPNGKYGENYNPKQSVVTYALGGAAALPTNATQKNIALAAMYRAGKKVDENLAFQCWKKNICDTGTGGKITVGLADGFGGNPARQLFKMEFILQALTYPQIGKIIYTDANLNTQKAISDVRSMIAQDVDVIVSYPDAGGALLPVLPRGDEARHPRQPVVECQHRQAGRRLPELHRHRHLRARQAVRRGR